MSIKLYKQFELPKRPGEWRTAKGEMNQVPEHAKLETSEMQARTPEPALEAHAALGKKKGLVGLIKSFLPRRKAKSS